MIKIGRPPAPPAKLTSHGVPARRALEAAFNAGAVTFSFSPSIYADSTVKLALLLAQHGKCCFCERKVGGDGDVEHFRPKGGWKQAQGDPLTTPGYYWLAYEWDNLFLCCGPCNQRHKKNLFPLLNPAQRALSHHHDHALEVPLFLKPDVDDPELEIGFRAEVAYARTDRGRATCEALDLNRDILCEVRLDRLRLLEALHQIVALAPHRAGDAEFQSKADLARALLLQAHRDEAEFAAACRSAIADGFRCMP